MEENMGTRPQRTSGEQEMRKELNEVELYIYINLAFSTNWYPNLCSLARAYLLLILHIMCKPLRDFMFAVCKKNRKGNKITLKCCFSTFNSAIKRNRCCEEAEVQADIHKACLTLHCKRLALACC